MHLKKIAFVLIVVITLSSLFGCQSNEKQPEVSAVDSQAGVPTMAEPVFEGDNSQGKPQFSFSWSAVYGADKYEFVIFADIGYYKDRCMDVVEGTSTTLTLLQGINTDTVNYRVKVKPRGANYGDWSGVWMIDYVDGQYTISSDAEDFDPPKDKKASVSEAVTPLPHEFPESLSQYLAKDKGLTELDLSGAKELRVDVNTCEFGYPQQRITDQDIVSQAVAAFDFITVTGKGDDISSTGTYVSFGLYDEAGEYLGGVSIQDGLIMENDGRYSAGGLLALMDLEGIMLEQDWRDYDEEQSGLEDNYSYPTVYPSNIFELKGYSANAWHQDFDIENVLNVSIRIDWNDYAGKLDTSDPSIIQKVYDALAATEITGKSSDSSGQTWYVTFTYLNPDKSIAESQWFKFTGDCYIGGNDVEYKVTGLDNLFAIDGIEVIDYLEQYRLTDIPSYISY